jgi:hypothetical protein
MPSGHWHTCASVIITTVSPHTNGWWISAPACRLAGAGNPACYREKASASPARDVISRQDCGVAEFSADRSSFGVSQSQPSSAL